MTTHGFVSVNVYRAKTGKWENICLNKPNLLTNSGRDWYYAQTLSNSGTGTRGANFIAVTNAASYAPAVGDTALTSELTVNGFSRADSSGSITHTAGTTTATISHTFTATGTQTAIQGSALFNAAGPPVAGQMTHAAAFTSTDLVTNDTLAVTWTINYT